MKLKRIKGEKINKNNKILYVLFIMLTLLLTVGYTALNEELNITGEATFRKEEEIRITNVELNETTNEGLENYESKYSKNTISVGVDLKKLTSTVKYKVTVSNTGSVAMWIESITEDIKNNNNMEYQIEGIKEKELINPGSVIEFYVTIRYKNSVKVLPGNTMLDEMIKFNFTKPESVLAKGYYGGATSTFYNGTIAKESVEEITFSPTIEIGDNAIDSWDASDKKDGTVIAWYTDSDANGLYELTIGGIGEVYANPNSSNQFTSFSKLTKIDFGDYFNTSNTTDMGGMFSNCTELNTLDVTNVQWL